MCFNEFGLLSRYKLVAAQPVASERATSLAWGRSVVARLCVVAALLILA